MTLKDAMKKYPNAETFKFGDSAHLCKILLDLVKSGKKTATCGALRDFQADGEAMPEVARQDIALNWDGTPALVIETVSVEQMRFCDVTADFALKEGENETLEGWQRDHKAYFERNGGFEPEMILVCERFRLVEVLG